LYSRCDWKFGRGRLRVACCPRGFKELEKSS
jgi:hypothetical protein